MASDLTRTSAQEFASLAGSMDVTGLGERVGLRAMEVIAELHDTKDKDVEQLTVDAALSNVHAVLRALAAGESPTSATPTEVSLNWAATLAQRGITVAVIPRCYVIGLGLFDAALRTAVSELDAPDDVKWQLAGAASQYLFGYCEKVSGDLVDHYQRERELWARGADSVRAELVLGLVSGRPMDLRATSAALGYNLDRSHVAMMVWIDPRSQDRPPLQALKRAAAAIAHQLKGIELLVVPAGAGTVWAWISGPAVTDRPQETVCVDAPLLASVGGLARGLDGFVASHHQARDGRRMSGVLGQPAGTVIHHRDVALDALLTQDLSAAGRFVKDELGELSPDTERNRRLRTTLIVFFEENMSWGRAAERLGVHQNTVMYRVQQAKDLLGRSLTDRRLELEVALRLADASANLSPGGLASAGQPDSPPVR
ncbi:helix-turn-helix domain-containing protein [Mycobacterium sp. NBC_00419]|uniref:PucR family transcriptional regulator n=1 Tax=Mycobacterium sp. NBC_00419 TaxID=2975989 RepID=UPI002E2486F3